LKPGGLISGIFRRYNRLVVPGMQDGATELIPRRQETAPLRFCGTFPTAMVKLRQVEKRLFYTEESEHKSCHYF
jgi:uncharacterized membrane protein